MRVDAAIVRGCLMRVAQLTGAGVETIEHLSETSPRPAHLGTAEDGRCLN